MIMTNKYLLIGAAAAGLGLVYVMSKTAGKVLESVNPLNNDNIINRGAVNFYQGLTGSDGTMGTDFWEATHGGALDVASTNNLAYKLASAGVGTVTGDQDASLGTTIYDGYQAIGNLWRDAWK